MWALNVGGVCEPQQLGIAGHPTKMCPRSRPTGAGGGAGGARRPFSAATPNGTPPSPRTRGAQSRPVSVADPTVVGRQRWQQQDLGTGRSSAGNPGRTGVAPASSRVTLAVRARARARGGGSCGSGTAVLTPWRDAARSYFGEGGAAAWGESAQQPCTRGAASADEKLEKGMRGGSKPQAVPSAPQALGGGRPSLLLPPARKEAARRGAHRGRGGSRDGGGGSAAAAAAAAARLRSRRSGGRRVATLSRVAGGAGGSRQPRRAAAAAAAARHPRPHSKGGGGGRQATAAAAAREGRPRGRSGGGGRGGGGGGGGERVPAGARWGAMRAASRLAGGADASTDWRRGQRGLDCYGLAAAALLQADCLVICAGAGMSADSGLAVYKDIAAVPAWRRQKCAGRFHVIRGLFCLRFTYVTPVLITKLRMETEKTPGQALLRRSL
jgi:hypothetical protein